MLLTKREVRPYIVDVVTLQHRPAKKWQADTVPVRFDVSVRFRGDEVLVKSSKVALDCRQQGIHFRVSMAEARAIRDALNDALG